MKSKLFLIGAMITAFFLGACNSGPSEEEQVNQAAQWLQGQGVKIDEVSDANPLRLNTNRETETKEKTRKTKGKTVKVKKNARVGEVVVVAPGSNCKFEYEFLLNTGPIELYPDEGRSPEGKETGLDPINTDLKVGDALKQYVDGHKTGPLAFCAGKPYSPSQHSND